MTKQNGFRISLITLILCLCSGSLVVLPILNIIDLSLLEISGNNLGNINLLDQFDFDEEIIIGTIIASPISDLYCSKSRLMNLDFFTACLSPKFPPPKHA